ncbi:efflux RND transporter permease subunit [Zoogloea sp. LCSB751]|uniref:efflux RND transporter permease subunit n=1 Tax=Zoogloea sp. LCSB751 TaxID=1965277 RepID=UPI0009A4FD26|nr:CusA/CzcA family heavy metal efflux RND transporter [Zoogloea sp. LCSB751]
MIEKIVTLCFQRRVVVWLVFLFAGIYGAFTWTQLPIEAYPDIADVTSQVITQVNGLAAEEIEQQITIPLERAIMGTPGMHVMRSKSTFGLSMITVVFEDGIENYWSRQRLQERMNEVQLPYGAQPGLDPLTSPIGEIYRYTLESPTRDLRELSDIQFWKVIPRLKQIPGVADVTNFGGLTTQFMLVFEPNKLMQFGVSLQQVKDAITNNSANAGGSLIVRGEQAYVIRGVGLIENLNDLANVVVKQKNGVPVLIKDLGEVTIGNIERRGILGKDRNPDTLSGIVLLLKGENPSKVLDGVHAAVNDLNHHLLPGDVKLVPYLDRSNLIGATMHTVGKTVSEGIILVVLVLLLFLGSPRAALIAAVAIPVSLVTTFILMHHFKVPANLLSLGAIDFGIIVDGAIVVVENILRLREENQDRELTAAEALSACLQIGKPIFFGMMIIMTAYLPLFTFQRVEYKLFTPMAFAVGFALVGAILAALLLVPGLAYLAYRKPRKAFHNPLLERIVRGYQDLLPRLLHARRRMVVVFVLALVTMLGLAGTIGRDFLPYLDEGSIWLQVQLPPGISLDKASQMATELRNTTLEFPQVSTIVTQLGRNDDGTDPWTPSHIEVSVGLKPYDSWPEHISKLELIDQMSKRFAQLPGTQVAFTQPMIDGVMDKLAGAHSELVVKIYGDDFGDLRRVATQIVDVLHAIPGAVDVTIDQEPPLPQVKITLDRTAAARFGINAADVAQLIETGLGGAPITQMFAGEKRYDVGVKFSSASRSDPESLANLLLTTSTGAYVPLAQVADIQLQEGESTVTREMMRRHLTVRLNLRDRDLASFLTEARAALDEKVERDPRKIELVWGGQFENQERAMGRLVVIVPLALILMFVLLYGEFGNFRQPALILAVVPLATIGGLTALHLRGMTFNLSSAVGFIAVFGVAVLNGIIMLSNLNRLRDTPGITLADAVVRGATERLRPVLMTATVAALGLTPAMLAVGLGSDVQRPLATVVVGGLVSATLLTLLLLPSLYYLVEERFARLYPNDGRGEQGVTQ